MKSPLNRLQEAAREILCCIVGHKYKFPDTIQSEYYNSDAYAATYAGWYKNVCIWHFKCQRCRRKWYHFWPRHPVYKELYRAFIAAIHDFKYWLTTDYSDDEQYTITWRDQPVNIFLASLFHSIGHFFVYWDNGPTFLWDLPLTISDRIMIYVSEVDNKFTTTMTN